MGLLRLTVHDWARLPEERLARVYVAASDELPFLGRAMRSGDQLVIERRDDSSGSVWVPWRLGNGSSSDADNGSGARGEWLIGTATLMERDEPYHLEVELARGSVYRLRNQLANWVQLGLESTEVLDAEVAEATRLFSRAAAQQSDSAVSVPLALQAINAAAEGSLLLSTIYAKQAMAVRQQAVQRLPTLLGFTARASLDEDDIERAKKSFSTVAIPCAWNAVEASEGKRRWKGIDAQFSWAQQAGMRVCAGPLIECHDRSIPDWAYLWEGDFEALSALMLTHIETVIGRYKGHVQLWNVAGRVNRRQALGLSDEQRLQLVARAVRTVREADPKTPAVVTFDQPWGEYLLREPTDLAPIDFADALERADLGIAGFGLELNLGYAPDGASMRNPLDFSRLLDSWSMRLELPLMLAITVPSSSGPDPNGSSKVSVTAGGVGLQEGETPKIDPAYQAAWVEHCLPMLLAKNCVQVVLWNGHRDDQPHHYPHGGLFDAQGKPKPVFEELRRLREMHLV